MQLAYKLLPVKAGQDEKQAIPNLRRRSRIYLRRPPSQVVRRTVSPKNTVFVRRTTCNAGRYSKLRKTTIVGHECLTHTGK
jgi:hypothetical protein